MTFAKMLAGFRRRERLSQLTLAQHSGVSQRHISFLESERSRPGLSAVGKLARALNLTYAETNQLYNSAGLASPRLVFDVEDEAFASAKRAVGQLLTAHAPYPAVATLRNGDIFMSNAAFAQIMDSAFSDQRPWKRGGHDRDNLYMLALHPRGLRRFMQNPEEIIPHTLRRLRNAAQVDEGARQVLRRVQTLDGIDSYNRFPEPLLAELASVLVERYRVRGMPMNLVSMVASFGSPEDVTAQDMLIELFFPDDAETERTMTSLSSSLSA